MPYLERKKRRRKKEKKRINTRPLSLQIWKGAARLIVPSISTSTYCDVLGLKFWSLDACQAGPSALKDPVKDHQDRPVRPTYLVPMCRLVSTVPRSSNVGGLCSRFTALLITLPLFPTSNTWAVSRTLLLHANLSGPRGSPSHTTLYL